MVAAGSGSRLGASVPKALVPVAGRPMLEWSIDALLGTASIREVVVALPAGAELPQRRDRVRSVEGGAERSHSVRAALVAAGDADLVLVHDAARPLVTPEIAAPVLEAVARPGVDAAVAAAPVSDTIKVAGHDGVVDRTLDRSTLWAVQTPQVFRREALDRVLAEPDETLAAATDDASLVEAAGGTVVVVETTPENFKVTTRLDLRVAELLLGER